MKLALQYSQPRAEVKPKVKMYEMDNIVQYVQGVPKKCNIAIFRLDLS